MTTTLGDEFVHQLDQELGQLQVQLERLALDNPNTTPPLSAQERRRWEHHFARLRHKVEDRARLAEMIATAHGGPESARLRETLRKTVDLIARLLQRPPEDGLLSEQMLEFQAMKTQLLQLKQQLGVPTGGMITKPVTGAAADPTVGLALGVTLVLDWLRVLFQSRRRR